MSEYWVSKNKYYCKYCETYIADDVPSRNQHENGLRHKGNKERFVRNLYKTSEKRKHDLEEEQREMARVEQAAQAAFARDVGAGHAKGSSGSVPARAPAPPMANYTTAESLGYTDPDAERIQAEAERRRMQGVVGDWQFVDSAQPAADEAHADAGQKREAPAQDAEDEERQFKVRRKTLGTGLGEIYDPGVIPVKLKAKKQDSADNAASSTSPSGESSGPAGALKWSARGWRRPGDPVDDAPADAATNDNVPEPTPDALPPQSGDAVKHEEISLKMEDSDGSKPTPSAADTSDAPTPVFRKRKVPAGGGSRGRRG